MSNGKRHRWAGLSLVLALVPGLDASPGRSAEPLLDPSKTIGPETCGSCHGDEFRLWQETAHARIFSGQLPLHKNPRALEIGQKLGVRLIQHDSLCLDCHYTPKLSSGKVMAHAGVSCESCHGAAKDWLTVHNTFEGRQAQRRFEDAEQTRRRQERNANYGMFSGGRIYDLVARCYRCHLVPEERLINVGGHGQGGAFDLVERYEQIRHNFVTGERKVNAPLSSARRRQFQVLGPVLELEWALSGLAQAQEPAGAFAQARVRMANRARERLAAIQQQLQLPELGTILAAAQGQGPGDSAALRRTADQVQTAARDFVAHHDGTRLAALDALPDTPSSSAPATTTADAVSTNAGEVQDLLRPQLTARAVLGPEKCESCHAPAADWWNRDPHARAAEPFRTQAAENVRIAALYYGERGAQILASGRSVCMNCHGTVLTGKEGRAVELGVSCESCHGPAGDYLRPHPQLSSAERLNLGMTDLANLDRRAQVCASCHSIVDRRLLSSGHQSGADFDFATGLVKIRHWQDENPPRETLLAAYLRAETARGPRPVVQVPSTGAVPTPARQDAAPAAAVSPASAQPVTAQAVTAQAVTAGPLVGVRNPAIPAHLRLPLNGHETVGPGKCEGCHGAQAAWWAQDAHQRSADRFFSQDQLSLQIAQRYYGQPAADLIVRGISLCMDCHGTVRTGKEQNEVESGVSCESCHGPAGAYLKPHPQAAPEERLRLGMTAWADLDRRAQVCASCHQVRDPRLLAAGHPTGSGFDLVAGHRAIAHWEGDPPAPAALAAAYQRIAGGPPTPAQLVRARTGDPRTGDPRTGDPRTGDPRTGDPVAATDAAATAPPPVAARSSVKSGDAERGSAERGIVEILLLIQERLEALAASKEPRP